MSEEKQKTFKPRLHVIWDFYNDSTDEGHSTYVLASETLCARKFLSFGNVTLKTDVDGGLQTVGPAVREFKQIRR